MQEFILSLKNNGALFAPAVDDRTITLATNALQYMHTAMLPAFMIEFYRAAGGANLGGSYIFAPSETEITPKITIPSIVDINNGLRHIEQLNNRTLFGRNDLFWFTFDAFGKCYMHDITTLTIARTYDDPIRAFTDCLIVGK